MQFSRSLAALALMAAGTLAQVPSPGGEPAFRALVMTPNAATLAHRLEMLGYDLAHNQPPGAVAVILSADEEEALQEAGLFPLRIETAQSLADKLSTEVNPGYRNLAAITQHLQDLETNHPSLVSFHDAASVWGPGGTIEGRPIPIIKISDNVGVDEDEPNVLFVSGHHCREIVTPEIALEIADRLVQGYASDPAVRAVVDSYEIWIAPIWNPDGLEYTWTQNNLWRKNRRDNGNGSFGVDLNRNYANGWAATCGGSTNTSSQTYRGTAPDSEPETQTMVGLSRDRHFAKVMDYHSSGREVLLGYTCSNIPAAIDNLIVAEGTALANAVTNFGYSTRRPSAEGEHPQWQIQEHTSYSFLTETYTSFQPPHTDALAEAAAVWPSALAFLERAIPLQGHVTDAATGAPLVASLEIQGINWSNGETRSSEPRFGRYHLWLPDGTYDVTARVPGYAPMTRAVTIVGGVSSTVDFPLAPDFLFTLSTTGGGVGDVSIGISGLPPSTVEGYTLFSFTVGPSFGAGPLLGLYPDSLTLSSLTSPAAPGNPLHWVWPVSPGLFPATSFDVGPGGLALPPGTVIEGVALSLDAGFSGFRVSNLQSITL